MKKVKIMVEVDTDTNINTSWIIGKLKRSVQGEVGINLIETSVMHNEDSKES